jgi:lysyl-tRNA synthetase class 2
VASEQKRQEKQRKKESAKPKGEAEAEASTVAPASKEEELSPSQYFELRTQVVLAIVGICRHAISVPRDTDAAPVLIAQAVTQLKAQGPVEPYPHKFHVSISFHDFVKRVSGSRAVCRSPVGPGREWLLYVPSLWAACSSKA